MTSTEAILQRFQTFKRESFLTLPTPLHHLNELSKYLKADPWIKRDDLTGFAMGGNKGRKLQYIMADALSNNADCIVACGAIQSNHVRQTAAAAKRYGLECFLVLLGEENERNGNLALERWLEAKQLFVGGDLWKRRDERMWDFLDEKLLETFNALKSQGRNPYLVPLGGSTPLGVFGFIDAVHEMIRQYEALGRQPFDAILFPSSSGGTHTGLQLGCKLHQLPTKVIGICADPEDIRPDLAALANRTCEKLDAEFRFAPDDFEMMQEYVGEGYALPSQSAIEAIKLLAQKEGIFLDPVYTGKAMAGLIDLVKAGRLPAKGSILFWHTGGLPALFAEEYIDLA